MRIPNHDTSPLTIACVSASARVPNSFVCDSKRQAAELRRTGREVARGFERKNWRCFPPETSPLVFVALLPLFSLSTQKKTVSFWTWTGQVQGAASHSWPALQGHRYLWVQSLSPPYRPPIPRLGKYSAMFTSRILDWDKSPMEGTNRRKSRAAYGQRCNPKRENSTRRNTCHRIDMVAAVFGCSKITISSKEIASRFCQCW